MTSTPLHAADQITPTMQRTVLSLDHVSRSFGEGEQRVDVTELEVPPPEALVTELADDGGPGAFINVQRDFLQ